MDNACPQLPSWVRYPKVSLPLSALNRYVNEACEFDPCSGMLKNLWDGSADFAWVPFAIDIRRIPYVDFMPTIDRAHSGIFIRHQNDQEFHWNLFLEMFSKELWCTLFVVALIISLTIFAMESVWLKPVSLL